MGEKSCTFGYKYDENLDRASYTVSEGLQVNLRGNWAIDEYFVSGNDSVQVPSSPYKDRKLGSKRFWTICDTA